LKCGRAVGFVKLNAVGFVKLNAVGFVKLNAVGFVKLNAVGWGVNGGLRPLSQKIETFNAR